VDMAKKGEIDPWNIDVVELADKFLKKVEELDLRFSARVLLYAAILVRMKAEILVSEAIFDEEEVVEEEFEEELPDLNFELPMSEESITIPEIKPKRPRRYTTLHELIKELRKAEMLEVKKRKRRVVKAKAEDSNILEVPHEEDIEETINKVYEELAGEFRLKPVISFFKFKLLFTFSMIFFKIIVEISVYSKFHIFIKSIMRSNIYSSFYISINKVWYTFSCCYTLTFQYKISYFSRYIYIWNT